MARDTARLRVTPQSRFQSFERSSVIAMRSRQPECRAGPAEIIVLMAKPSCSRKRKWRLQKPCRVILMLSPALGRKAAVDNDRDFGTSRRRLNGKLQPISAVEKGAM